MSNSIFTNWTITKRRNQFTCFQSVCNCLQKITSRYDITVSQKSVFWHNLSWYQYYDSQTIFGLPQILTKHHVRLRITAALRIHYHYDYQCSTCSTLGHPSLWSSLSPAQAWVSVKHALVTPTFTGFNNGTGCPLTPGGVTLNLCLNLLTGIHSCARLPWGWGLGACSLEKERWTQKKEETNGRAEIF